MRRIVYEAINETLKEIFVGWTAFPIDALRSTHHALPPRLIAHWRFQDQKIDYREVERDITEEDLKTFIQSYAASIRQDGWKIILE